MIAAVVALALIAAEPRPINLDVKDADLHNVIRLLAEVGKVNIVVPDTVAGKVTIKLHNTPWKEALDVVLAAKGLGQVKTGNVIRVDTLEAISLREQHEAELVKQREQTAQLLTVIIPVSYASATELKPIVQSLLSPRGSVIVDARTNSLLVTDVAGNVDRVKGTLQQRW